MSSQSPPVSFGSTQDEIESIKKDLEEYHHHPMSGRHCSVQVIGAGVRELKDEVYCLREQLRQSRHNEHLLQNKLAFYQQREEDELIALSLEHDRQKDTTIRKRNFSTYASANYSPHFTKSYK